MDRAAWCLNSVKFSTAKTSFQPLMEFNKHSWAQLRFSMVSLANEMWVLKNLQMFSSQLELISFVKSQGLLGRVPSCFYIPWLVSRLFLLKTVLCRPAYPVACSLSFYLVYVILSVWSVHTLSPKSFPIVFKYSFKILHVKNSSMVVWILS